MNYGQVPDSGAELLGHVHRWAPVMFAGLRVCRERFIGQGYRVAGKLQDVAQRFAVLAGARGRSSMTTYDPSPT